MAKIILKTMANLDTPDIQGFVLSSYASKMTCATYVLLKVADAALGRKWLNLITAEITTGEQRKTDYCLNIAFTAGGLLNIGFTKDELATFPVAFQEGMTTSTRKVILGDDGINESIHWSWGNEDKPVDILLLLFAKDENELDQRLAAIDAGINRNGGITIIKKLGAGRQPNSQEHFGFLDGVGQPVIEGTGQEIKQKERTAHATVVKAGEFVLGYENEMQTIDPLPEMAALKDFGRNGTYLVFRQLEQHVHTFWNYLRDTTAAYGNGDVKEQERLGAKIVGRWRSGAPVTSYPNADPAGPSGVNEENNFSFASGDFDGSGCPVGAHIRRTNPRDSLFDDPAASALTVKRHRILRRGRSYGDRTENLYENDGKERGLHFICLNSNIERQFEFIQQSWVNNQNFAGLNEESDPLIGHRGEKNVFSIPGCPVRRRIHDLTDFVTTKGGAYFFMPGMAALAHLSKP